MARMKIQGRSDLSDVLVGPLMQTAIKVKGDQVKRLVDAQNILVGDTETGEGSHEVPLPVEVETGVSDRARASVSLAHPAGQSVQAKHGSLTKAAAQAGLDVKGAK